jgi:hypothetical protein
MCRRRSGERIWGRERGKDVNNDGGDNSIVRASYTEV